MKKKYLVELTKEEREDLHKLISSGSAPARKLNRARILLKADTGKHAEAQEALSDLQIAQMLETSIATVQRARERFYEGGLETALERSKPDRVYKRSLEGRAEAHLIALACSEPPQGRDRWSLRLLADKAVELGFIESISHETVRKTLKKNELKPHLVKQWVIPPEHNAQFVWRMEEILDLYEEPYDPNRPVVCFDERPCQLLAEVREPLVSKPGKPQRVDFEYERRGMANVLLAFEPLKGRREMKVTEHRRMQEFADMMRYLADDLYPEVERIRLVVDNLNTHSPASFYESFPPEEARRLSKKIEFIYTPKHGSWLNMVEIEISVLVRQCLKRRIPDIETLRCEAEAWCEERNRLGSSVDWRFTTADARIKLRKLYPSIDD